MDIETIILLASIVISSLIIGFIGGFFSGAYWKMENQIKSEFNRQIERRNKKWVKFHHKSLKD